MVKQIILASLLNYIAHLKLYLLIKALQEKKKIVIIARAGIFIKAKSIKLSLHYPTY